MLDDLKRIELPFTAIGMQVGSHHALCPNPIHEKPKNSVSCQFSSDGAILWSCHSCNAKGSIIDAFMLKYGIDSKSAISMIQNTYGSETPKVRAKKVDKIVNQIGIADSPPPELPDGSWVVKVGGKSTRLKYSDATFFDMAPCLVDGVYMVAAAVRWDVGGDKVMRQCHWNGEWIKKAIPSTKRPIYNMKAINNSDMDTLIMVVEGEKCMHQLQFACDEAVKMYESFPDVIVTTNLGGSKAAKKAVWDCIGHRQCIIIRDNDQVGHDMARMLSNEIDNSRVIDISDANSPSGYDIADWLDAGNDVRALLKIEHVSESEDPNDVLKRAMSIAETIEPDKVDQFLKTVIKQGPDHIFMDILTRKIHDKTDISLRALNKTVKLHEDASAFDWYDQVARQTIRLKFKNNLILADGIFWGYSGTHWVRYQDETIRQLILSTAQKIVPPEKYDAEQIIRKSFTVIKAVCATEGDVLRRKQIPHPIINMKNGELHINPLTGDASLKDHDPKSFLTHCLDCEFDPSASCEEYDKAIQDIFCGNQDLIRHYHEIGGYLIQPTRKFKNFFVGYGGGHNGKSSMFKTLTALMGHQNVCFSKIDTFGGSKHDTSMLLGKIMLLDDDLNKGTRLSDGLIKQLSEQKPITIEYKHKDHFEIISYAAVVMLANHWPTTVDLTDAMISRASILPFDAKFEGSMVDRHLFDRIIINELPGVLNQLLAGLKRLFRRDHWQYPDRCVEIKKQWLGDTSNLYAFITQELTEDPNSSVHSKDLRMAYDAWCKEEGVQERFKVQTRRLKNDMSDLGFEISNKTNNNKGKWKVVGFKLNEEMA